MKGTDTPRAVRTQATEVRKSAPAARSRAQAHEAAPVLQTETAAASPSAEWSDPADEDLFLRAREGESECLAELVKRYEARLYGLLVHLTAGDQARADDLFQETFLRAMRAGQTFDPARKFKAWITAIAVNLVRDDARKRKIQGEIALNQRDGNERDGLMQDTASSPLAAAEKKDEARRVREALPKLTMKEREVVLLHFFDGMTLAESAEALDIPLGTVKSRLHGALTRLKSLLG